MSNINENQVEFEIKKTLGKILDALNEKMGSLLNRKNNECTKSEFFNKIKYNEITDFPISRDTYYNYSAFVNKEKSSKTINTIDLRSFYYICKYTDVSADYFLGFCNTKRKEQSAQQVRDDFGLSDKSMETLSIIKKNRPEVKGELSSDIVNMILENQDFWQKLNDRLPIYLSNINYSRADIDVNVARYALSRAFEELIDDICSKLENDALPHEELDNTGVFCS